MTSPHSIRRPDPTRDSAVDLVRAGCVIAVILLHSLMVGVTVTAQGPVFENAGDSGWWLTPVSWLLQVMPLFFVIGGFSGSIALRRSRTRGGDGGGQRRGGRLSGHRSTLIHARRVGVGSPFCEGARMWEYFCGPVAGV